MLVGSVFIQFHCQVDITHHLPNNLESKIHIMSSLSNNTESKPSTNDIETKNASDDVSSVKGIEISVYEAKSANFTNFL